MDNSSDPGPEETRPALHEDMTPRWRRFGVGLLAIAIAALILRVVIVLVVGIQHLPLGLEDAAYYHKGANFLADGYGFVAPFAMPQVEQSANHPPLYILWLSIPSLVAGGVSPTVHLLWSCVLGAGTVVLCGLAGREIAGPRVGLLAAGVAAIYPNVWVHDTLLRSETTAVFMTAAVILLAYRFLARPTGWRVLWLGAACGFAALARPELVLALPLVVAPMILFRRELSWTKRIQCVIGAGIATVIVLTPWIAYNLSRFEKPVYMSSNFGSTLVAVNCDGTYYGKYLGFKDYACASAVVREQMATNPRWEQYDESERDALLRKKADAYINSHTGRLPVVIAARWGRIAGVYQPIQEINFDTAIHRQPEWLGYLLLFSYYATAAAAIVGIVVLRRRRVQVWPLVAIVVIVLISVATTFAQVRYRAPAEVVFVLGAAVALDAFMGWVSRRRSGPDPGTDPPRIEQDGVIGAGSPG